MKGMVKRASALASLALLLGAVPARADQTIVEIDWTTTAPMSGHVEGTAVVVEAGDEGGLFPLIAVERPAVEGDGYTLAGEVRYSGVDGLGYLEMWSVFEDGSRYFSRTLDDQGPLAAISGTSGWRPFELPFYLDGGSPPERLEINVALPGAGQVQVGPLRLLPLEAAASTGWWSDRTAGLAGGIAGSVMGVLGGTVGMLVARRRARGFVTATMAAFGMVGILLLIAAGAAVASSQPYAVWYPLALLGGLLVLLSVSLRPVIRRAYVDAELRRMRAMDQA